MNLSHIYEACRQIGKFWKNLHFTRHSSYFVLIIWQSEVNTLMSAWRLIWSLVRLYVADTLCINSQPWWVTSVFDFVCNSTFLHKFFLFTKENAIFANGNINRTTMKLRNLLAFLLAIVAGLQSIKAQEAYTVLNGGTMTFYYDNLRSSRPGTSYPVTYNTESDGFPWENDALSVNRVVFDSSYANARPTSTHSWFDGMENLTSIEGMANLPLSRARMPKGFWVS